MADPQALRDLAIQIAREVAPGLRTRAGRTTWISTKSSVTDLVSDADRWSEELIVARLNQARPHDEIVSEEGTRVAGTTGIRWLVDPIDGTTDFVYGHPGFSISIGAELDGTPVAGVVFDPLLDEVFAAAHDAGATRNGRAIEVRADGDLSRALVATGFGYKPDQRRRQAAQLVKVLPQIGDIRRMGGAALDLASVACGRVDAFFEQGLAAWDVAAGRLLVTEAGGRVVKLVSPRPFQGDGKLLHPLGDLQDLQDQTVVVAARPNLIAPLTELLIEAGSLEEPQKS